MKQENRIPKMLVFTPLMSDANSFWRCAGPLSYLDQSGLVRVEFNTRDRVHWSDMIQYDIIFLHRPCSNEHLQIMQLAKSQGKPVWVDFDDWLFGIPEWNPTAYLYNATSTQMAMAQCLVSADLVSVSTTELFNQYRKVNPNVVILSNAYRSDMFKYRKMGTPERQNVAVWRGTNTHDGDLLTVREGFEKNTHTTLIYGSVPWQMKWLFSKAPYQFRQPTPDVVTYFKSIYDIAPKVFIFPLMDCLFNRCKSNICWMEALHAGALCIAPDLPEWNRPGVITYIPHNSESFLEAINQVFEMSDAEHKSQVEDAFLSMIQTLDISEINEKRVLAVRHLLSHDAKPEPASAWNQQAGLDAMIKLQGTVCAST